MGLARGNIWTNTRADGVMDKVNITARVAAISDHWNPRIAGELNGQQVKLVKLLGEFIWHHHES